MNKSLIIALSLMILVTIYLSYSNRILSNQYEGLQLKHEQQMRVQWEYLKGCEARMMYLDNVVEKHGIEVIH